MKRSLTPGVALLLVVLPLFTGAQPLADRLPASTMVYVGWTPSAALQNTAAARMLADERVMGPWRKLFHELIQQLPDMGAGQGASAHVPALLREAVQCEGCFALLELKQDARRRTSPQSVLMIDLGARRKSFEEHFKPINALMRERYGESLKMMKLDNSWVWFRADRDGRPRLTWGFVGDVFVMFFGSTGEDFIPKLVKGQFANDSLKSSPAFADTMGKLPGESAVFSTYLDVKASFALLRQLVQREGGNDMQLFVNNWDKVLDELGVANVKGVAEKTTIEDRQFVTRTLARTDGAPRGLLAIAGQAGVEDAFLRTIPADAMMAGAWRLDLLKFLEQIKRSAVAIAGRDAEEGFRELEQAAAGFGLPLNDVLGAFGDQWAIYNAQSQGGFALTGWTLVGTIRDADKFRRSTDVLRGVLARAGGDGGGNNAPRLRELDADGVKVEYVQLGRWEGPFAPAWAVVGDKLVVALYPQHVEDAVAHLKGGGGKSLLDNPDFVAARKRTGQGGPMLYMSGPKVVDNLYPIGMFFVSIINAFGGWDGDVQTGADLVPSYQRLLRYVGHDVVSVRTTPDGLVKTRTVTNPLLSPIAWFDSPVVAMAVLIPTITGFEESGDRVRSAANLRQIGQGLMLYANENKGLYPDNLQVLTRTQDLPEETLRSPAGPAKVGPDVVYLHFKGMNNALGAEVPVAYDAAFLEQGEGTNVLFGDGHVDWVDTGAAGKLIEEAKKRRE